MNELIQKIKKRASDPKTIHDMAMGLSPAPMIGPKLKIGDIEIIENDLGFELPDLLKKIYIDIGDGGFGPGYGLYSLKTSVELYLKSVSSDETKRGKFPVCTWGCANDSYIDCLDENFPVMVEKSDQSEDCGCMGNLKFKITDKNGNEISSGNGSLTEILASLGSSNSKTERAAVKKTEKKSLLIVHKNSIDEWFSDWVNGVDIWGDMEVL